jgi:hypothetical protein
MAAGAGIASPTGRDIDGKYLDMNEKDLKDRYAKSQNDWPIFGVSLMCDSWTGPTRMSVINFLYIAMGSRGFTSLLMQLENLRIQTISRR